ncbi:MAG: hypothetical protein HZB39_14780 [Planctomycetes bacterium]|nr:hypothetical protein [Planctomycetota bacterium]
MSIHHDQTAGDPGEDDAFRDADLAAPGLPSIRADFVDRATARVVADLARIRAEAEAVDDLRLPRTLLDEYAAPSPSLDFVARTAAAIAADRGHADDAALRDLLERYTPPKISAGFVARTLDALRDSPASPSLRLVRDASPPRRRQLRRALVAAAALVIVVLGVRAFGRGGSAPSQPSPGTIVASALSFSPSSATTAFARLNAAPARGAGEDDLDLVPLDGLLLLAQGAMVTRR